MGIYITIININFVSFESGKRSIFNKMFNYIYR